METDNLAVVKRLILSLSNPENEALLEAMVDEAAELEDEDMVLGEDTFRELEDPAINYSVDKGIFSPETSRPIDYLELFYGPGREEAEYVLASADEEEMHGDMKEAEIILEDIQMAVVTSSTYLVSSEKMKKMDFMFRLDYGRFAVLNIGSLTNDIDYSPIF